jgi:hypothetical protein
VLNTSSSGISPKLIVLSAGSRVPVTHRCLIRAITKVWGRTDCTKFEISDRLFSLRLSKIYGAVCWAGRWVQLGTIAMGDLILVLSIFAVGAGCGYFVRDRISKKRRELYLKRHELHLESKRRRRGSPALGRFLTH